MSYPGESVSHDMNAFRDILKRSSNIVVLSGAGISAESGVPTFRGAGGLWRRWQAQELATPESFSKNPSLVWEFYNYRRDVMRTKHPNKAHEAISQLERDFEKEGKGRKVTIITQNIDRLHHRANSKCVLELHGSLFHTRCTVCHHVEENYKAPICPALEGRGAPDPNTPEACIPAADLPRCEQPGCGGLLRPHVVWFGEPLFHDVLQQVNQTLDECDLCLLVGTSSVVYPAAAFAPKLALRGVPVAEFNLEDTPVTGMFQYHFQGKAGDLLPIALAMNDPPADVLEMV